jgi:hypothetical protein
MTAIARELTKTKSFWLIAAFFFGVASLADYHYSTVNQIPSDGPLTIGFPMTFYRMVCPMIVAAAGACETELSALGFTVDLIGCLAFAMIAAIVSMHCARRSFVKRALFWTITGTVGILIFLLISLVTALHSASHHGHAIEIGFPAVYLYEYAGDSFNALNLATDLVVWFVVAFLGVAQLFRR